jgi:hypothetical protein
MFTTPIRSPSRWKSPRHFHSLVLDGVFVCGADGTLRFHPAAPPTGLCANADAYAKRRRFDVAIQGTTYRRLPTSRYRVWCLERLRRHYDALPEPARAGLGVFADRVGRRGPTSWK